MREKQDLFDLQWKRSMQANRAYSKAHPRFPKNAWPDLGALLTWLLGEHREAERLRAKADKGK